MRRSRGRFGTPCAARGLWTNRRRPQIRGDRVLRYEQPPTLRGMQHPRALRYRDRNRFGVSRRQLGGPSWASPTHGVHLLAADVGDLATRCRAIQLALPDDAVFTHITAAALRGWWLPSIRIPVIACSNATAPHLDRRGVYIRRCAVPSYQRLRRSGLRVASAERTLLELAEDVSLVDLVIAIDAALHFEDTTLASLSRSVIPGRRGVRNLREALTLADHRSESPWETVLRLLHKLGGIDVTPQYIVTDDHGVPVARGDLRVGESRRLHEYDGAVHREGGQHGDDLGRDKALARIQWERYGYTAKEIRVAPGQILRDAENVLGLPHDRRRVAAWLAEYDRSSLAPAGWHALIRRLRRFDRSDFPRRRSSSGAR